MAGWTRIRSAQEETACPECAWPLYLGDTAWEDQSGEVYCCAACAADGAR